MTYIKLALGFIQLANWIAKQVSQAQWKASGLQEAAAKYSAQFNETVGAAQASLDKAKTMTPEERRRALEE